MKLLTPQEEAQLLEDCLQHGKKERVIQQYWVLVYNAIYKIFSLKKVPFTPEDIEDLRNLVFIRLFEKDCRRLRAYDKDAGLNLAGWIRMITVRIVLNNLKKKGFHSLGWREKQIEYDDSLSGLFSQKRNLDAEERLCQLKKAMEELPSRDRLVLKLFYFHELSMPEIASYVHRSVANTYTIKSRALVRLKKLIEKDFEAS